MIGQRPAQDRYGGSREDGLSAKTHMRHIPIKVALPNCYGVCCPCHGVCARYLAVEGADSDDIIATCEVVGISERPLFVPVSVEVGLQPA